MKAINFTLDVASSLACYAFVALCGVFMAAVLLPSWLLGGVYKGEPWMGHKQAELNQPGSEWALYAAIALLAIVASAMWPGVWGT